jgi:arginase
MWHMPKYAILEAPSALGHVLEHLGVERAPDALLAAGLADGLAARRAGRVAAEGYSPVRDPRTKILNPRALADYSSVLAGAVAAIADRGEFPVVLGGDCSILLGAALALKRRGRYRAIPWWAAMRSAHKQPNASAGLMPRCESSERLPAGTAN